jgi:8-oxo-dGTP pyrophosphatase MutT (NUDIX family)
VSFRCRPWLAWARLSWIEDAYFWSAAEPNRCVGSGREVKEETGLEVEPVELIELLDRIHRQDGRVQFHYVIADYLCTVVGGSLRAASDADEVRWVERAEWNSHSALALDPIAVRVIEAGWQRARKLDAAGGGNR